MNRRKLVATTLGSGAVLGPRMASASVRSRKTPNAPMQAEKA